MAEQTTDHTEWDEETPTGLTERTLERGKESKRMAKFMESNLIELCETFEREARAYITWLNANSGEGSSSDFTSENSPHKELTLIDRANMGRFVVQDTEARFQRVAELYSKFNAYFESYEALSKTNLEFGLTPELKSKVERASQLWDLMKDLGGNLFEATAQELRAELERFWANVTPEQDPNEEREALNDEPSLRQGGTSAGAMSAEA